MEVRCCCNPGRLLGWLAVPPNAAKGARVRFRLQPLRIEPGQPWSTWPRDDIELEVGELVDNGGRRLALKSGELPIAVLRRVQGFREAVSL